MDLALELARESVQNSSTEKRAIAPLLIAGAKLLGQGALFAGGSWAFDKLMGNNQTPPANETQIGGKPGTGSQASNRYGTYQFHPYTAQPVSPVANSLNMARQTAYPMGKAGADESGKKNEKKQKRDKFEDSSRREGVLRRHAGRLNETADERARDEDASPMGYVDTAVKRTIPVPHGPLEGLVRGGAGAYGAYKGYQYGKSVEPLDHKAVGEAIAPASGKPVTSTTTPRAQRGAAPQGAPSTSFNTALGNRLNTVAGVRTPNNPNTAGVAGLVNSLSVAEAKHVAEALQRRKLPFTKASPESQAIQTQIGQVFPGGNGAPSGINDVRREMENLIAQRKTSPTDKILGGFKPRRLLGGLAGGLAGGAIAGLPFMLRALYLKSQGGEAAVDARNRAQSTLGQADSEYGNRENLLTELGA